MTDSGHSHWVKAAVIPGALFSVMMVSVELILLMRIQYRWCWLQIIKISNSPYLAACCPQTYHHYTLFHRHGGIFSNPSQRITVAFFKRIVHRREGRGNGNIFRFAQVLILITYFYDRYLLQISKWRDLFVVLLAAQRSISGIADLVSIVDIRVSVCFESS